MGRPKNKGYKRSWKNLLLNKRYQLRFTLFMVIMSAALMAGLGWWVMSAAAESTSIGVDAISGSRECLLPPKPFQDMQPVKSGIDLDNNTLDFDKKQKDPGARPSVDVDIKTDIEESRPTKKDGAKKKGPGEKEQKEKKEKKVPSTASTPKAGGKKAGGKKAGGKKTGDDQKSGPNNPEGKKDDEDDDDDDDDDGRIADDYDDEWKGYRKAKNVQVVLDRKVHPQFAARAIAYYTCQLKQARSIADVRAGQDTILWVLVAVGLLLTIGLTLYGIKMTHKVAGPLHKVSLYFAKMRDEKYDKVWNLRKGDQLVEFYDHFKAAHDGICKMQRMDIEQLKAVIAVADKEDLAAKSPDVAAALDELRETLKRKEESFGN